MVTMEIPNKMRPAVFASPGPLDHRGGFHNRPLEPFQSPSRLRGMEASMSLIAPKDLLRAYSSIALDNLHDAVARFGVAVVGGRKMPLWLGKKCAFLESRPQMAAH
jgi:hypothetical protein